MNKRKVGSGKSWSRGWTLWLPMMLMASLLACAAAAKAQTTQSIPVGWYPNAVAVNSNTNQIYVSNWLGSSITIINGDTNATTTIPLGANPQALAVNSRNRVYVVVFDYNLNGNVIVIDGNSATILATVPVGREPMAVAIDHNTDFVYVTNATDNTVTVINGSDVRRPDGTTVLANSVFVTDSGGAGPGALAVNEATDQAFVAASSGNQVVQISGNPAFNVVPVGLYPVGANPSSVAVNKLTNKVYVANNNDPAGSLSVLNPVPPGSSTTVIPQPICAYFHETCMINVVAVNERLNKVYATSYLNRSVFPIDGATNRIGPQIFVGHHPNAMAVDDARSRIYVTSDDGVTPIDTNLDIDLAIIPVGRNPHQLAVNTITGKVYVTNMADSTLTVITP